MLGGLSPNYPEYAEFLLSISLTRDEEWFHLSRPHQFDYERFGLIMFGSDYAYISLVKKYDQVFVISKENIKADKNNVEEETASFPVSGTDFYLEINVQQGGVCHFGFSTNGEKFITLLKPFVAKPGRWVGAKIGMFCLRNNITNDAGYADVDWFRITEN